MELGAGSLEQIRLNTELLKSRFTEPPTFFGLLVCPRQFSRRGDPRAVCPEAISGFAYGSKTRLLVF